MLYDILGKVSDEEKEFLDNVSAEEKNIINELLRCNDDGSQVDKLVLKYLDSFFQEGIEVLVDDGYELYVQDCEKEMIDYIVSQINDKELAEDAIGTYFDDLQSKKSFLSKIEGLLRSKYEKQSPAYHRSLAEYIEYADSPKTRDEFAASYSTYKKAVDDLLHLSTIILRSLETSRQSEQTINAVDSFINRLEQLKDRNYYELYTYQSDMPVQELYYQEMFMSEEFEIILQKILDNLTDIYSSILDNHLHCSYSLEDVYQMIPDDIISDELLADEEYNPKNMNYHIEFVQKFYKLCLVLCQNSRDDDEYKKMVNSFLTSKVVDFPDQLSYYCKDSDEDDDEFGNEFESHSFQQYVYVKKNDVSEDYDD